MIKVIGLQIAPLAFLKDLKDKWPAYWTYVAGGLWQETDSIWNEVNYHLGQPGKVGQFKTMLTGSGILLLFDDSSLPERVICKLALNNSSLSALERNYRAINILDHVNVPEPVVEMRVKAGWPVFGETYLDGVVGLDLIRLGRAGKIPLMEEAGKFLEDLIGQLSLTPGQKTEVRDGLEVICESYLNIRRCWGEPAMAMERIIKYLFRSYESVSFPVGLTHGDFWLGNILFSDNNGRQDWHVNGVVDWDRLDIITPLFYDKAHLYFSTQAECHGRSIGSELVRSMDRNGFYTREEALLYWLIFLSKNSVHNPGLFKSRRWVKRNISNVISNFAEK